MSCAGVAREAARVVPGEHRVCPIAWQVRAQFAMESVGGPTSDGEEAPTAAVCLLFAGGERVPVHLAGELRRRGAEVAAYDTRLGGRRYDLLRPEVQAGVLRDIGEQRYDVVFLATPCKSYSPRRSPRLRWRW